MKNIVPRKSLMTQVRVFQCPSCHEFIATDAKSCRFCSVPIDPESAQIAADAQDQENVRYMRRRYMRHMLIGGAVFLGAAAFTMLPLAAGSNVTVVYYGLILYGVGDFLYGVVGVLGTLRLRD